MYNAVGDWKSGKVAWSHTQVGNKPSYYAVYFDRLKTDQRPPDAPPTGWLGDAMPRHERWSKCTTGADTTQITLDDWNEDGLFDIVYGEQYGQLFFLLNQGTAKAPEFRTSQMIFESDGKPLDIGVHAAPLVIDWDEDGARGSTSWHLPKSNCLLPQHGRQQNSVIRIQGLRARCNRRVSRASRDTGRAENRRRFQRRLFPRHDRGRLGR